jgi:peptidyl-prolyl cis-trans isomerase B (cyclophilin B)
MKIAEITLKRGTVLVYLSPHTPATVANFEKLANGKFYDGLTFHRVVPRFMAQGGCPQGDGFGWAGYVIDDEFHPTLKHDRGVISMCNSGPNTGSCQFFITTVNSPHVDQYHCVFGRVLEGLELVDTLHQGEVIESIRVYDYEKSN